MMIGTENVEVSKYGSTSIRLKGGGLAMPDPDKVFYAAEYQGARYIVTAQSKTEAEELIKEQLASA